MKPELLQKVLEKFPNVTAERALDFDVLIVPAEELHGVAEYLRNNPELEFNFLSDLSGVDYIDQGYFEVVYHLFSYSKRHKIRLKVRVNRDDPIVKSVTGLWSTANWHEREAYDLYGIVFKGHPDLKRILCAEDFPGHPFRKDFPLENDEDYLLSDVKTAEDYGLPKDLRQRFYKQDA